MKKSILGILVLQIIMSGCATISSLSSNAIPRTNVSLSGANASDAKAATVTWDTLAIGYPNKQNSYLWTLSDQTVDIPLAVGLISFTATAESGHAKLEWRTASEINSLGFEIEKTIHNTTSLVGSWESNAQYRSRSGFGAAYDVIDPNPIIDSTTYSLFERNSDGERELLATRTLALGASRSANVSSQIRLLIYPSRGTTKAILRTNTAQPVMLTLFDLLGRQLLSKSISTDGSATTETLLETSSLPTGVYILRAESGDAKVAQKFVIGSR